MIVLRSICCLWLVGAAHVSAQCTQLLERTPIRFSQDAEQVLIEVIERDSCYPDGVGGHRVEIRRTSDLALVERVELQRGARDWSDPATWQPRSPQEVEVEIERRRASFLRENEARFPVQAVRHDAQWEASRLVFAGSHWAVPRGLFALAGPYAAHLPFVEVWMPAHQALRVAVGTARAGSRDRLVVLRS